MKKLVALALILSLVFSLCACGKTNDETKEVENEPIAEEVIEEIPADEFYKKITSSKSRPVAVMIDNDSYLSRPQWGIENAFIIYEAMVEGASTRMMALFLDSDVKKVGPVRSSRHYFLDYALENDAIYAHCGFSPQASNDIKALGVNNINELYANNGKNFFRDSSDGKKAPHNLYASLPELIETAKKNDYDIETKNKRVFSYSENDMDLESDLVASEVSLPYIHGYTVSYKYNEETKLYDRYINSKEHTSLSSKEALKAKNIIVYKVKNYSIDDIGRQNLENIGSGEGYYISNGKCIDITWTKTSRKGQTQYKTKDGKNLVINPGNTFVQIMPVTSEITIK